MAQRNSLRSACRMLPGSAPRWLASAGQPNSGRERLASRGERRFPLTPQRLRGAQRGQNYRPHNLSVVATPSPPLCLAGRRQAAPPGTS
jgi:hypothetical protein